MKKELSYFVFSIGLAGSVLGCKNPMSLPPPEVQATPLAQFGIKDVDDQLLADFDKLRTVEVSLEKNKKMPLHQFLNMVKEQLECPNGCEAYALCSEEKTGSEIDYCEIQWSKLIEQPMNQDLEPGSIWTLAYRRIKSKVELNSVSAYWKDF